MTPGTQIQHIRERRGTARDRGGEGRERTGKNRLREGCRDGAMPYFELLF